MANSLFELFLVGHVQYSSFRRHYFRLAEPRVLQVLEQDVKILEADLKQWNAQIERLRSQCYELNYFSSRQLSLICQQLSVSTDSSSLTLPWFSNLLLSITPVVKAPLVLRAAKRIAADRERTDQRVMLGLHSDDSKRTDPADVSPVSPVNAGTTHGSECVQPLTVDDLDEVAKDIFDYLSMTQEFSEVIVLRGLAEFGSNSDAVENYCLQSGALEISLSAKTDLEYLVEDTCTVEQSCFAEHAEDLLVSKMIDQDFPVELIKEAIGVYGDDEDKVFSYCESEEKNFVTRQQGVNASALSCDLR